MLYRYILDVHCFGFLIWLWWYIFLVEDHGYLISFEKLMMCTLSYLMVLLFGLFLWLEDGFFIMMSWIDWIHNLVGACDSDEVIMKD